MSAKKSKPPEILPIGGIDHIISREPMVDNHGEYDDTTRTIKVNSSDSGPFQDSTVCHEIFHAALDISGLHYILEQYGELEEAVVRCMENIALPAINEYYRRKGVK
jgi:hypothetical protein